MCNTQICFSKTKLCLLTQHHSLTSRMAMPMTRLQLCIVMWRLQELITKTWTKKTSAKHTVYHHHFTSKSTSCLWNQCHRTGRRGPWRRRWSRSDRECWRWSSSPIAARGLKPSVTTYLRNLIFVHPGNDIYSILGNTFLDTTK